MWDPGSEHRPRSSRRDHPDDSPPTRAVLRRPVSEQDVNAASGGSSAGRHRTDPGRRRHPEPPTGSFRVDPVTGSFVTDPETGSFLIPVQQGNVRSPRKKSPLASFFGAVTEAVVVVALALALALVIKTFLVQAFFIPSASMEPTLTTGDRVLVSKLTPGPFELHRGDIIVFKDPGGWLDPVAPLDDGAVHGVIRETLTFVGLLPQDSGEHLIKRVIGLPGDTVTCCDAQGRLQVNGVSIEESYIYEGNDPSAKEFSITLGDDQLWVMGDHRAVSEDSRYHPNVHDGTVPMSSVVGKAVALIWPWARVGTLSVPSSVFAQVPDPASPG
jgi:signal peptidase I